MMPCGIGGGGYLVVVTDWDEMRDRLEVTRDRLERLVNESTVRVLLGAAEPGLLAVAYAALDGRVGASEGLDCLRTALAAESMRPEAIAQIEACYLQVLVDL
jgi:hypothetical protein